MACASNLYFLISKFSGFSVYRHTSYNLGFGDGSEFFLDNSLNHWFFYQEILDGNCLRSTFFQAVIPKWCQDSFDEFSFQVWQNHCIDGIRANLGLNKLPSSHDAPLLVCRPRKSKILTVFPHIVAAANILFWIHK